MCRLLAYKGRPLPVDDLLYRPDHSLVKQSYQAAEVAEPLNGDGFGLGWYEPDVTREPAVFASVTPAWNNRNLRYMAPKLVSPCILAHVRAAILAMAPEARVVDGDTFGSVGTGLTIEAARRYGPLAA